MATYRIKKYFLKKKFLNGEKRYIICATVFKYRFGFLVDFWDEWLDSNFLAMHQKTCSIYHRFHYHTPMKKECALLKLTVLKGLLKS